MNGQENKCCLYSANVARDYRHNFLSITHMCMHFLLLLYKLVHTIQFLEPIIIQTQRYYFSIILLKEVNFLHFCQLKQYMKNNCIQTNGSFEPTFFYRVMQSNKLVSHLCTKLRKRPLLIILYWILATKMEVLYKLLYRMHTITFHSISKIKKSLFSSFLYRIEAGTGTGTFARIEISQQADNVDQKVNWFLKVHKTYRPLWEAY